MSTAVFGHLPQAGHGHMEFMPSGAEALGAQIFHADGGWCVSLNELLPFHASSFLAHATRKTNPKTSAEGVFGKSSRALPALFDSRGFGFNERFAVERRVVGMVEYVGRSAASGRAKRINVVVRIFSSVSPNIDPDSSNA